MATGGPDALVVLLDPGGGVVDVSTRLRAWTGVVIEHPASSDGGLQPATLALQLDNSDGALTPASPTSLAWATRGGDFTGAPIFIDVVRGASTWRRFAGVVTSVQPVQPADEPAFVAVRAVDALGQLQAVVLESDYTARVLELSEPLYYGGGAYGSGRYSF